jgi:alkaline phosphatase
MDTMSLIDTLAPAGPIGICGIALVEKLMPVVPSYVVFVTLGMMMTASSPGDIAIVMAATASGSTLGALWWYGLGFALGPQRSEAIVERFGRYILLKPSLYRRMASAYTRNHFWVTAISQTIPTVRVYISIPAGVLNLPILKFLAATLVGSLAWSGPLLSLGYLLRQRGADVASGLGWP